MNTGRIRPRRRGSSSSRNRRVLQMNMQLQMPSVTTSDSSQEESDDRSGYSESSSQDSGSSACQASAGGEASTRTKDYRSASETTTSSNGSSSGEKYAEEESMKNKPKDIWRWNLSTPREGEGTQETGDATVAVACRGGGVAEHEGKGTLELVDHRKGNDKPAAALPSHQYQMLSSSISAFASTISSGPILDRAQQLHPPDSNSSSNNNSTKGAKGGKWNVKWKNRKEKKANTPPQQAQQQQQQQRHQQYQQQVPDPPAPRYSNTIGTSSDLINKAISGYRSDADTEVISNTFFSNDHQSHSPNNIIIRGSNFADGHGNGNNNISSDSGGLPTTIGHPCSHSGHSSTRSPSTFGGSGSFGDSDSNSSITSKSDADSDSDSDTGSSNSNDTTTSTDTNDDNEDKEMSTNHDRKERSNTIFRSNSPARQIPVPKDSDQGVSRKSRPFHHGASETNSFGGGRGDGSRESDGRLRSKERIDPDNPHNKKTDPNANSSAFRRALATVTGLDASSNKGTTHAADMAASSTHSNKDAPRETPSIRKVSWASDPKNSFSDWRLEISYWDRTHRELRVDVYHLHKNMVAFGARKSECILRDIQEVELREALHSQIPQSSNRSSNKGRSSNNNGDENKTECKTRIDVPSESQAKAVPMVLDFLYYTKEMKHKLTADMACNIFKVAELMEVSGLQKAIGDFYMRNLSLKNLGEFLSLATKARADKLLTICKAKIGQMITEQPELSKMVPPKFMADILCISSQQLEEARVLEPETYTEELIVSQSLYWSKAACICASANENILTARLFQRLTSEDNLPYIDVTATPKLLSIEAQFLGTGVVLETTGKKNPTSTTTQRTANITAPSSSDSSSGDYRNEFTSLQRRCIESIANDFESFQSCFDSPEALAESLRHLPSSFLAEILLQSRHNKIEPRKRN